MEILSQSTDWASFITLMTFFVIGALLTGSGAIYGIYLAFKNRSGDENLITAILLTLITIGITTIIVQFAIDGPTVEYKAIVTDWNEVYDGGYEVFDIDGKIVTLRKD